MSDQRLLIIFSNLSVGTVVSIKTDSSAALSFNRSFDMLRTYRRLIESLVIKERTYTLPSIECRSLLQLCCSVQCIFDLKAFPG